MHYAGCDPLTRLSVLRFTFNLFINGSKLPKYLEVIKFLTFTRVNKMVGINKMSIAYLTIKYYVIILLNEYRT